MAHHIGILTVAIDRRLMVIAIKLRFVGRPFRCSKRIGRDEGVALRTSFNRKLWRRSRRRAAASISCCQQGRGLRSVLVLRENTLETDNEPARGRLRRCPDRRFLTPLNQLAAVGTTGIGRIPPCLRRRFLRDAVKEAPTSTGRGEIRTMRLATDPANEGIWAIN
jgi:hypothetical protein